MTQLEPVIGNWYRRPGRPLFEVVAIDDDARTIEIQFFDGTVDEVDEEIWQRVYLESAEPPEDYSGSVDMDQEENEPGGMPTHAWDDPLNYFDLSE